MSDLTTTTTTVIGRPFPPGVSGNPAGRPKLAEVQRGLAAKIRNHPQVGEDGEHLIARLVAIATEPHQNTKARIEAIKELFNRGWGRALESLHVSGGLATLDPAKLVRLSDAELEQAAAIVAKLVADED